MYWIKKSHKRKTLNIWMCAKSSTNTKIIFTALLQRTELPSTTFSTALLGTAILGTVLNCTALHCLALHYTALNLQYQYHFHLFKYSSFVNVCLKVVYYFLFPSISKIIHNWKIYFYLFKLKVFLCDPCKLLFILFYSICRSVVQRSPVHCSAGSVQH